MPTVHHNHYSNIIAGTSWEAKNQESDPFHFKNGFPLTRSVAWGTLWEMRRWPRRSQETPWKGTGRLGRKRRHNQRGGDQFWVLQTLRLQTSPSTPTPLAPSASVASPHTSIHSFIRSFGQVYCAYPVAARLWSSCGKQRWKINTWSCGRLFLRGPWVILCLLSPDTGRAPHLKVLWAASGEKCGGRSEWTSCFCHFLRLLQLYIFHIPTCCIWG